MIIGHEKAVRDLAELASKGALAHGYLFIGPSMTGKKAVALSVAYFLEKGIFDVPGESEVLQDLKLIDAATRGDSGGDSIGIDAVREIKNFLWQKPNASSRRTLVIDDAELLTTEAQNALLKITEEPPSSSLLILVTSDPDAILPTIVSRLPMLHFGHIANDAIVHWLENGGAGELTKSKIENLALRAMGKPGLAWRLVHDEALRANIETAGKFLKTPAAGRKEFIKKLIEPEDFNLRIFVNAVIMVLAWEKPSKARTELWHKALRLSQNESSFSLNPRLQLNALLMSL